MKERIKAVVTSDGGGSVLKAAILTTERSESSHGLPVVVVTGEDFARGPAELGPLQQVPERCVELARRAGYTVETATVRLHIPDLPEPLHRRIKAAAAAEGKTLKEWAIEAFNTKLLEG